MSSFIETCERHQVMLYLGAILIAAAIGFGVPEIGTAFEPSVTPVLGLLLYSTFLGIPVARVGMSLRDWRFLLVLVGVNFVVVPIVAFAITRIIANNQALLVGALLVLLTPCIDYVIVFTRIAGGSADKLLAATPILLAVQMVLLPLYLGLMVGPAFLTTLDLWPFLEAFLLLILLPFAAATLTQLVAKNRVGARLQAIGHGAIVPLMMVVLIVVIASQIAGIGTRIRELAAVVPIYALFIVIVALIGGFIGRMLRMKRPDTRALLFGGVTRNSLVVLPLALALPAHLGIAPLAIVTQTLVELIALVILVRLVPRFV